MMKGLDMDKYKTIMGDTWDIISFKVYGSSAYISLLVSSNLEYINTFVFNTSVTINVPKLQNFNSKS